MPDPKLPKFKNPPVVETVLGIQFERLPGLGSAHLGAFWESLGTESWPNVSEQPPISLQFERFGVDQQWGPAGPVLSLSREVSVRLQIRNRDQNRMVQVQNGRMHYNWLGFEGDPYPSYETVEPEFRDALQRFQGFLVAHALGEVRPTQWEVTYVNHIPRGTVWETPEDWASFFPSLATSRIESVPIQLEGFSGEWHYVIKSKRGRLHVRFAHGRREKPTEQEIIELHLTARGPIHEEKRRLDSFFDGLKLGHETIVRAFKDLTSGKAHDYWGLEQ